MKKLTLFILACQFIFSCGTDRVSKQSNIKPCKDLQYTRLKEFKNLDVIVVKLQNDDRSALLLQPIDSTALPIRFFACNFPEEFAKNNAQLLVSGYQLTFPGIENSNMIGVPFEISQIDLKE